MPKVLVEKNFTNGQIYEYTGATTTASDNQVVVEGEFKL
jgi:hypothetical protein